MSKLLVNPERLRRLREKLLPPHSDARKEVARLEALAECNFRLAVHIETPAAEALGLLRDACRLDGANPKYAYHLARLFFIHGRFDDAVHWLRLACCLSPTSHRIWAHVGQLQTELNQRYAFNDFYEPNALLKRSERITEAIGKGSDTFDSAWLDFVPPQSLAAQEKSKRHGQNGDRPPSKEKDDDETKQASDLPQPAAGVPRLVRPGVCRWSGIKQLQIEQLLRGRASGPALKQLMPLIEEIAAGARQQASLRTSFVILAIQWLICGYPVATIRRLMLSWPDPPSGPAWDLLNNVCELFELPVASVPERIARAVQQCELPALLAAIIHQRRLLWRPLEFRALVAYRTARQLLAKARRGDVQDGQSEQFQAELDQAALRLLRASESLFPAAPKPLADMVVRRETAPSLTAETALQSFEQFAQAASSLDNVREQAFHYLKAELEPAASAAVTDEQRAQIAVDRTGFEELLALSEQTANRCTTELESLLKQISQLDATAMGVDFERRSDECGKALKECCNSARFSKVLKRIDKALAQPVSAVAGLTPAAKIRELRLLVEGISPRAPVLAEGPLDPVAAQSRFYSLELAAAELAAVRDDCFTWLKEDLSRRTESCEDELAFVQVRADVEAVNALVAALKSAGEEGSRLLASLQAEIAHLNNQDLGGDFDARREACGKNFTALTSLANYQRVLKRLDKQLTALLERFPDAQVGETPSPQLQQFVDRRNKAAPVAPAKPADVTAPAATTSEQPGAPVPAAAESRPVLNALKGAAGLRQAIGHVESEVDRLFREAHTTFAAYPAWCRLLPPLQALEASVLAREAETMFRMGQTARARRIWNQMLLRESGHESVLRNLAVCDTLDGDTSRSQSSWRRYLETLYQRALLAGHAVEGSAQRVHLHRAVGHCHAPPFLCAKMENDWSQKIDTAALLSFLCSSGRVRGFVDHLMLEYLNSRFEFRSPALTLGIKRVEAERLREPAAVAMQAFIKTSGKLLPERVRAPFIALASEAVADAAKQCGSTQRMRLSQDSNYPEEERRQIDVLIHIVEFRLKLVIAFQKNANLVKHLTSLEFLSHLDRLDEIPIGQSPELLKVAGNSLGLDEEMLANLSEILRKSIVGSLMRFLLSDDDAAERPNRDRLYKQLVGEWVKSPALASELKVIEDTTRFLPEEVLAAFQRDAPAGGVLDQLRALAAAYPGLGGLSRLLANLLFEREGFEEAEAVVERARKHAFYPPGLAQLNRLQNGINARRMQKYWDDEAFEQAIPLAREMIELDDAIHHHLLQHCLMVIMEGASRLERDPGHEEIDRLVSCWFERAMRRRGERPVDDEEHPVVSDADLAKMRELAGLALARMILGPLGELSKADGDRVVALMNGLLARRPGLVGAHFCRALGWLSKANAAATQGSSVRRSSLQNLIEDMGVVEQQAVDESLRKQAASLRQQAEGQKDR